MVFSFPSSKDCLLSLVEVLPGGVMISQFLIPAKAAAVGDIIASDADTRQPQLCGSPLTEALVMASLFVAVRNLEP
jgi:hypothetical protein